MTEQTPQDAGDGPEPEDDVAGSRQVYDHTLGRALGTFPAAKAKALRKITPAGHKVTLRKAPE